VPEDGLTVIELPVPICELPHPPVYQYTVPWFPFAVSVVEIPLQIVEVPDIDVGASGYVVKLEEVDVPEFPQLLLA
jgi:hypothetical protein